MTTQSAKTAKTAKTNVSLDLDALDREGAPAPFTATIGGETYTFTDAQEFDVDGFLAVLNSNIRGFLTLTLSEEAAEKILAVKTPTWKMRKLMDAYIQHFGALGGPGE